MTTYAARLHQAIAEKKTPALVGLDPRFDRLPEPVLTAARRKNLPTAAETQAAAFEEFCVKLIDVVAPLVPAVKPQAAFFEELGPAGCAVLQRVIRYAREQHLIVICDAKRGDIGSTAEAYARGYLAGEDPDAAIWAADALTVNPYLGSDTLEPFAKVAEQRGAGIYVLVRTSNPGSGTFQGNPDDESPLYHTVARSVQEMSSKLAGEEPYGSIGAVIGATYPAELRELRTLMPNVPLLVPGFGAQGGGAADVADVFDDDGFGALINSSRGINFAFSQEPYADRFSAEEWEAAAEQATRTMIADLARETPAAKLTGPGS